MGMATAFTAPRPASGASTRLSKCLAPALVVMVAANRRALPAWDVFHAAAVLVRQRPGLALGSSHGSPAKQACYCSSRACKHHRRP